MSTLQKKIVKKYTYKRDDQILFVILDQKSPGKGFKQSKNLSGNGIRAYINDEGTLKLWFNPKKYGEFEYVIAKFSVTPPTFDNICIAIASLRFRIKTGHEPSLELVNSLK